MRAFLIKMSVFLVTFGFTAFIFANTYEVVFNRDIALVSSVKASANQTAINGTIKDFETRISSDSTDAVPALDKINRIEIPALDIELTTEEARRIDGEWYARPSTAHYMGLNKNKYGVSVDYLIYTIQSWRTLQSPQQIEQGMEVVFYYGSGASTSLEVTEKKVLSFERSLLVSKSEKRQILLLVEDQAEAVYYGYSLEAKN